LQLGRSGRIVVLRRFRARTARSIAALRVRAELLAFAGQLGDAVLGCVEVGVQAGGGVLGRAAFGFGGGAGLLGKSGAGETLCGPPTPSCSPTPPAATCGVDANRSYCGWRRSSPDMREP
jgi:hypothetical protein